MNLQLYRVDDSNYLVDFRNVGHVRLEGAREVQASAPGEADARLDVAAVNETLEEAYQQSTAQAQSQADLRRASEPAMPLGVPKGVPTPFPEGRKDVSSPFLFLECATRLM